MLQDKGRVRETPEKQGGERLSGGGGNVELRFQSDQP